MQEENGYILCPKLVVRPQKIKVFGRPGGVPARVIGSFYELYDKRMRESKMDGDLFDAAECWRQFYKEHESR